MGRSLKRDVGMGLVWVAIATVGSRGLSFLRDMILARLLVPGDFGLVGYALLIIGVLALFQELGFSSALIYRNEDVEEAADVTFITVIVTSVVLYGLAWGASLACHRWPGCVPATAVCEPSTVPGRGADTPEAACLRIAQ